MVTQLHCQTPQHLVANSMAIGIVDEFEVVEIDEEQRWRSSRPAVAPERVPDVVEERSPVQCARQGIVRGSVEQVPLPAAVLEPAGHVEEPVGAVEQVVVHPGRPLKVRGVGEVLAEAGGAAVVDAQDRVAAVGEPLDGGVEIPMIAPPRAAVDEQDGGERPGLETGWEREVAMDDEAVSRVVRDGLHARELQAALGGSSAPPASVPRPGQPEIAKRAGAYGLPGVAVDGQDVRAVYEATSEAVARARRGEGPTLIEAKTYRRKGHAEHDDQRYVPEGEIEWWEKNNDPVDRFERFLLEQKVATKKKMDEITAGVQRVIDEDSEWAESSPMPDAEGAAYGVFDNSIVPPAFRPKILEN